MPELTELTERQLKHHETAVVRRYLEHCLRPPRRGRPVTVESVQKRLAEAERQLLEVSGIDRAVVVQRYMDLQDQLAAIEEAEDAKALEAEFVTHAWNWAARKGISYAAFRASGVPARVLRDAGF